MSDSVELHYLGIEWQEPGRARRIEIAPEPIDIEPASDDTMSAETHIFNDMHPWVGLRLRGVHAGCEPAFIMADGKRQPMLRLEDDQGGYWWVQNDGWDAGNKRHLSELHRTMGLFKIAVGQKMLLLDNVVTGQGRAQIDGYLRDFQQELIWLVMGFGATAASGGGALVDQELLDALTAFISAARKVIINPARNVRETRVENRTARLRPNTETFRHYLRRPAAQRLVGRGTEETANIAENRYLRHMVQICERLCRNIAQTTDSHAKSFAARARMESGRRAEYLAMEHRDVDPEIFDRQLAELEKKLERVSAYRCSNISTSDNVREFRLKIGERLDHDRDKLFYNRVDGRPADDKSLGIRYSLLQVPEELAEAMEVVRKFSDEYTLLGVAKITRYGSRKDVRLVSFSKIVAVTPHTEALSRKRNKRERLVRDGWRAPLTTQEREEMRQEARTAELRAQAYEARSKLAALAALTLAGCQVDLKEQDQGWNNLGVASSPLQPMGVRFSQSPDYASCLRSFLKVNKLADRAGLGQGALDAIERIGILHASSVYERWCLVKIIGVLIEDHRFRPEVGWQDSLIRVVTGLPESFDLRLFRDDLDLIARLQIQPVLPNGRRPDFRLLFESPPAAGDQGAVSSDEWRRSLNHVPVQQKGESGLVMDAKFRARWRRGELESVLESLILTKDYGQEGDRVFILQPASGVMLEPTSPLAWARDCDYGQEPGDAHRKGAICLSPGTEKSSPLSNLRRLIALLLQATFPEPEMIKDTEVWTSHSLCIRCGRRHEPSDVEQKWTRRRHPYWILSCLGCGMKTTRTHCFGGACGSTLFKNGLQLTYHRTVADQVTNVVCPKCGEFFDRDVHG